MATFLNSFFSKAGQVERLSNVGNYAKLAASKLTFGLIKAPTQNPSYKASGIVENIAQKVADHPYATAGVVASTATAVKQLPKAYTALTASSSNRIPARTSTPRSTSSKPGMISKVASAAGGMIQKSMSPASPTPVSQNTGIITKPSAAKAPSTRTRRTKRRSTRAPKRKKVRKTTRRKSTKRKSRKKRFGTAKQYKRKGGKSVKYTKNGQPYIILSDGRARFVKGKRK